MSIDPISTAANAVATETGKKTGEAIGRNVGLVKRKLDDVAADKAIADLSAFTNYLQRACSSVSRVKTILYSQPTSLKSFFVPTYIRLIGKGGSIRAIDQNVSTDHVDDVLRLGYHLIIAGSAGMGKSIIMRHLFIDTYNELSGGHCDLIPIYVELRAINDFTEDTSVVDLAFQSLKKFGFEYDRDVFERSFDFQNYLFLLDGLDEVSDTHVETLRNDILDFGERYPRMRIIISSRMPEDEFRSWQSYVVAKTVELNKEQAIALVKKLSYEEEAKTKFVNELDCHLYERHKSFASSPLLLTMMLMVFSHRAFIPDDLTEFYSQAFDTLLREHDATKRGMYRRELKCGLSDQEFKLVFSNFCFTTFMRNQFGFDRENVLERIDAAKNRICMNSSAQIDSNSYLADLMQSVCMLQRDGRQYSFVHRSFQEYFAARYTMRLPDDSTLKHVVFEWINEHKTGFPESSVYFRTLPKLNRDRYLHHVLYDWLRELRDTCADSRNPIEAYVRQFYKGVSEVPPHQFENEEREIAFVLRPGSLWCFARQSLEFSKETSDFKLAKQLSKENSRELTEELLSILDKSESKQASLSELEGANMMGTLCALMRDEAERIFAYADYLEHKYESASKQSIFDHLDAL